MAINRTPGLICTALAALLLLSGCASSSPVADATSTTTTVAQADVSSTTTTLADPPVDEDVVEQGPSLDEIDWQIDWDRVGPVQVGSSLEEITAALGPGFEIADAGTLGDGLGGYSVALDDEVLFYLGSYESGNETFELLIVDNPRLGLASGIRPGMSLGEAVDLHGEPRLWFHSSSHGRELVSFSDSTGESGETIQIQTQGIETLHAGIYGDPEPEDEALFVTNDYDPSGTICSITVTCFGAGRQSCQP